GAGVARGYLGRPALTAERFVPDPFASEPGARLYRTGDRARWRADGTLEFLGRLDGQVKVRGFRIETGEVESALREHPGVADCAVVVRADAPGEARLVAYVAGEAGADGLRAHLRTRLPEYMVPAAFVAVEGLPRTPSGKLDRRALPAPAPAQPPRPVEPGAGLEARIAAIWAEVLGLESVGAEDNFFDLGGHSLLLTRLQGRLVAELGHPVPLVDLFHHPTVRSLARALQGVAATGAAEKGEARGGVRQAVRARLAPRRPRA
ncbi:MAG TPA: phosphopantetheine-binding protein, partial [Longimicrobium sp.]|nr:phosphopantetheine-binding protein [Longimicrobium sp.]